MSKLSAEELADEIDRICSPMYSNRRKARCALSEHIAALERELGEADEALNRIKQWCEAYPLDIFPEPDFARAAVVLKEAHMTLDAISASNMRYALRGVGKLAAQGLRLSPSPSELAGDVVSQPPGIDPTRPGAIGAAEVFPDDAGDGEEC